MSYLFGSIVSRGSDYYPTPLNDGNSYYQSPSSIMSLGLSLGTPRGTRGRSRYWTSTPCGTSTSASLPPLVPLVVSWDWDRGQRTITNVPDLDWSSVSQVLYSLREVCPVHSEGPERTLSTPSCPTPSTFRPVFPGCVL